MKKIELLDEAIEKCLSYIAKEQKENGSFHSLFSTDRRFKHSKGDGQIVFFTSLILICLKDVATTSRALSIASKGIDFLLSEKIAILTWNYWQRQSTQYIHGKIPDDLDDTFCALSSLSIYRPHLIDGIAFAAITKILTLSEIKAGGPYATWCTNWKKNKLWFDVDPVVNANIAFFLNIHGVHLPNIDSFLEKFLATSNSKSNYYDTPALLYFISKSYRGNKKNELIKKIRKTSFGKSLLGICMKISSLQSLSDTIVCHDKEIMNLVQSALNSDFPPSPLYIEEKKEQTTYAGSDALTAAFCLETLYTYKKNLKRESKKDENLFIVAIRKEVVARTRERLAIFPHKIQKDLDRLITAITVKDPMDQIILLPSFFCLSLKQKNSIPRNILVDLGFANLCGWIAYKIYDDLLDDEGEPLYLGVANVCLRIVSEVYSRLMPKKEYESLFTKIMDNVDRANAWERLFCKVDLDEPLSETSLPDYEDFTILSQKSFAHALGPLCILLQQNIKPLSSEMNQIKNFFKHYIIARQLNDDAHDWAEDLNRGFLNSVSSSLIKTYLEKNGGTTILINEDNVEQLRREFWLSHIENVVGTISFHTLKAEAALQKLKLYQDISYFQQMLAPVKAAAKEALEERELTLSFLKSYST